MSERIAASDDGLRRLAGERLQRLRQTMRERDTPVMLVLDSVNIQYATGATNMTIFSTRTPARYLLLFADGPSILFEYFGCEHLAAHLDTIDEVRPARGLCHVSSGGDSRGAALALADDIVVAVRGAGLTVERLAVDRFPFAAIDALRDRGFTLHDADAVFSAARRIAAGELLCFDTDAVGYAGYCVDFSRSFLCGDEAGDEQQLTLYARAREQLEHNIALIRTGASYREIAEGAWQVPPEHQDSRYYCIAHGLGMSGEYPNISHSRRGQPYPIDGELEVGMVLCVESYIGCARAQQGVKLEDQLLVTDSGIERMSAGADFDPRLSTTVF